MFKNITLTKDDIFLISSLGMFFANKNFSNLSISGPGNPLLLKHEGIDIFHQRYMKLMNKIDTESYTKDNFVFNLELTQDELDCFLLYFLKGYKSSELGSLEEYALKNLDDYYQLMENLKSELSYNDYIMLEKNITNVNAIMNKIKKVNR